MTLFDFTKTDSLSQVLERSRAGTSHSAVTNFRKNIPERSISCVFTQIRNCVKLLNLAPNRSFSRTLSLIILEQEFLL